MFATRRAGAEMVLLDATLCLIAQGVAASAGPSLPDTFVSRLQVLASMETLNANILASRSATKALEAWCGDHALAIPAKIHAERLSVPERPVRPEQRDRLKVGPDEPIKYRRVRLTCGGRVLSEADNWYVPARLTPAMNRLLETTDVPFGKAVAALDFTRETFATEILWPPLPAGWETRPPPDDHPDERLAIPPIIFEHQAMLSDKNHRPFAEVDEHYTREVLNFAKGK